MLKVWMLVFGDARRAAMLASARLNCAAMRCKLWSKAGRRSSACSADA